VIGGTKEVEIHFGEKDVERTQSESKTTKEEMNKRRSCGVLSDVPTLIQIKYMKASHLYHD
jgi:hypothetical protein